MKIWNVSSTYFTFTVRKFAEFKRKTFQWGIPHVTITHDALYLTVQPPPHPPAMGHGEPPPPLLCHISLPIQIWDKGPLTPAPALAPPTSDIWWPSLETYSNLFIGPHCTAPTHQYWHLVATKAHTVGKQAVCIRLECFLVRTMYLILLDSQETPFNKCIKLWKFQIQSTVCFILPSCHTPSLIHDSNSKLSM